MENESIATRLKTFMESEGLSNSQFADECGIPRPSLSQLLSGRNKKISDVIVGQIHSRFPGLSVLWLMFGEGQMMVGAERSFTDNDYSQESSFGVSTESPIPELRQGNLFGEDLKIATNDPGRDKKRKEMGLEMPSGKPEYRTDSKIDWDFQISQLKTEIEKLKKNPRKVSQITIYYDDSTFETFFPR